MRPSNLVTVGLCTALRRLHYLPCTKPLAAYTMAATLAIWHALPGRQMEISRESIHCCWLKDQPVIEGLCFRLCKQTNRHKLQRPAGMQGPLKRL